MAPIPADATFLDVVTVLCRINVRPNERYALSRFGLVKTRRGASFMAGGLLEPCPELYLDGEACGRKWARGRLA